MLRLKSNFLIYLLTHAYQILGSSEVWHLLWYYLRLSKFKTISYYYVNDEVSVRIKRFNLEVFINDNNNY